MAGKWIDAVPIPGTFVVKCVWLITPFQPISMYPILSLGDQFSRWTSEFSIKSLFWQAAFRLTVTDDVFKSTLHRVINRSGAERYSIPLFFVTDYNVLLEVSARL